MNFNGSPGSPFAYQTQKPLPRNYAEEFNEADYECKDSIELESYARNLSNYLNGLLTQTPFPANLFEKLEKRLNGIICLLQKRSAARGVLNKDQAKERLQALGRKLDATAIPTPSMTTPIAMVDEPDHPPKKRKISPCIPQVRKDMEELRRLKRSYSDSQSTQPVDEEEEEP